MRGLTRPWTLRRTALWCCGMALLVSAAPLAAGATTIAPLDLKALTQKADDIVIGVCGKSKSRWHNKKIFTDTEIVPSASLKRGDTAPLTVTHLGGVVGEPYPLRMTVPRMPVFSEGERVVLFVYKGPRSNQALGLDQGKLTITTDADGTERVVSAVDAGHAGAGDSVNGMALSDLLAAIDKYLREAEKAPQTEVAP